MEADDQAGKLKPPTGDNASITSTSKKSKKKSAVAKLAERKRRSSGSEFGSSASLQSSKTSPKGQDNLEGNKSNNTSGNTGSETKNKTVKDKTSSEDITPKPAPRHRKTTAGNSDWDPPPKLDEYESDGSPPKNEDGVVNKKAPSDATIHRFRALKMANDPSGSMESLKNLQFVPKPPETPKKEKTANNQKGEKRNREPYSSGDEQEIEAKASKKQTESFIDLKSQTLKYSKVADADDVFMTSETTPEKKKMTDSETDLKNVRSEYEKVVMGSPGSKLTRAGQLPPVSPKNYPPPVGNISSASLKTSIRSDAAHQLHRYFSDSGPNSSRRLSSSLTMPPISTQEARASVSIIGASELDKYFPDRRVTVWAGTWNVVEIKECKESLTDFLLPESNEFLQDIYAIGTQENNIPRRDWEVTLQATLGPNHVLFHSASHGALHLAIFIRRDLIWFCSVAEEDIVTTRAVTMVKTKGAVAISFCFFGTSMLFVNSHFTSDDGRLKERINDFHKVSSTLKTPKFLHSSSQNNNVNDVTSQFDCVFWVGDLNFRIEKGRHTVEDLVKAIVEEQHPNFEDLLKGDELFNCISQEQVFNGYQEGRINFKPTYKFDIDSDVYDTSSKLRIPSYTDRVLFRSKKKNGIACLNYDAVMNLKVSDHRPVFGVFEALIKPGRDTVPLAAGQFDRDIYREANKQRQIIQEKSPKNQKSSNVCTVQ
ncbi:hypothetical protein FSP39_006595 [Pinctada imbricata]|uniref:Inositol polyphosphate-related phosphatase domain-containing protein n=1 Tax=Pinctada imbricata TaxID=66713 RepID=A0AA88XNC6_PINIB|nr:hypothetical protein FSP39_006595 [Pinctada imbricata]